MLEASSKRKVHPDTIWNDPNPSTWEAAYERTMDPKYKKNTRNFSTIHHGGPDQGQIYIVPRVRAGPSYKEVQLSGVDMDQVVYCPISKGFPMQNVSSFTLGPFPGEGLCLVNAAFSKQILVGHIEGGGILDLKRKNFWKRAKNPLRKIEAITGEPDMKVDGVIVNKLEWLRNNEHLWLEEWEKWRKAIALCSLGDFHWNKDMGAVIGYANQRDMVPKYQGFVEWKINCYVNPSWGLLGTTDVIQHLLHLRRLHIPLALVHPMGYKGEAEKPLTKEELTQLFYSSNIMACQPYVVAAYLLWNI